VRNNVSSQPNKPDVNSFAVLLQVIELDKHLNGNSYYIQVNAAPRSMAITDTTNVAMVNSKAIGFRMLRKT
jgi:hypothetical protein